MTVEELIVALLAMPRDAQVWADDGYALGDSNPVTGVRVDWRDDVIIQVQG